MLCMLLISYMDHCYKSKLCWITKQQYNEDVKPREKNRNRNHGIKREFSEIQRSLFNLSEQLKKNSFDILLFYSSLNTLDSFIPVEFYLFISKRIYLSGLDEFVFMVRGFSMITFVRYNCKQVRNTHSEGPYHNKRLPKTITHRHLPTF